MKHNDNSRNIDITMPSDFIKMRNISMFKGIWFQCGNVNVLLPPESLVESLVMPGTMICNTYSDEKWFESKIYYELISRHTSSSDDLVIWTYTDCNLGLCKTLCFRRTDYISVIKQCFNDILPYLKDENTTIYKDMQWCEIKHYLEQMDLISLLNNSDVSEESLYPLIKDFKCKCFFESYDIRILLSVGSYTHLCYLSDWSNDLSELRFELESGNNINIYFEDSATVIKFYAITPLNTIELDDYWLSHWKRNCVIVKITPNEFAKTGICYDICLHSQVIKAIYEGLLQMASKAFKDDNEYKWDNADNICFYNKIKSPFLERKLRDISMKNFEVECRQVKISHVLTVTPGSNTFISDENDVQHGFVDTDVIGIRYGNIKIDLKVDGIQQWWNEYNISSELSPEWMERGKKLVQELRNILPDEYDLWLDIPYDKGDVTKSNSLIYKDYKILN